MDGIDMNCLFPNRYCLITNALIACGRVYGAGTAYLSGAPEFTPLFSGVRVIRS
jgi:hypothetical protein